MGLVDRLIRLIVAATLIMLYLTNVVTGTAGIILAIIAGVFTLTSFISFCPLYTILGINTCKTKTT